MQNYINKTYGETGKLRFDEVGEDFKACTYFYDELESVEVSDEELEEEYANLAAAYNMDVERVKSIVAPEDLAADKRVQKAVALVKENAVITEA